jgi:short-subunit dehydrogenase
MEYVTLVFDKLGVFALAAAAVLAYRMGQGMGRNAAFSYGAKHVMITGGSSGIGLESAKECIRRNASAVTIVARDAKKLQETKDLLEAFVTNEQKATKITTVSVDCGTNQETVDAALRPCFEKQPVDVLVRSKAF